MSIMSITMTDLIIDAEMLLLVAVLWLVLEVSFFLFLHFVVVKKLQNLNKPQKYVMHPVKLIKKILDSMDKLKTYSFDRFLHGFFRGAKRHEIKKQNMYSFLAWAMHAAHLSDLNAEQLAEIDEIYSDTCARYGALEDGHSASVRHIAMTLEPVPYIHRPLALYVAVGVLELFTNTIIFRLKGFQRFEHPCGMSYWYRPGKLRHSGSGGSSGSSSKKTVPLVFYHGICPGWLTYIGFVETLSASSLERDVFLMDLDCIKIKSMSFHMPSNEAHADSVAAILKSHGVDRVSIVGHSFGTIAAAWFVRRHADKVSHLSLIDPVSLLLFFPDVSYAFLYRFPSTFVEWVIYLGAAREITIANTLYRNFWWYNNLMWLEDLPVHIGVVVGISGSDQVSNPTTLLEYVKQCGDMRQKQRQQQQQQQENCNSDNNIKCTGCAVAPIEAVYWPGFSHGQVLVSPSAQRSLQKCLVGNEAEAD